MSIIKKNKELLIFLGLTILLSLFFPFSGDDWFWGSKVLSFNELKSIYNDLFLNGRWIGNILAIIISKNHIIKALIIGIVLTFLVFLISKKEKINAKIIYIFIFSMPIIRFNQCIIWGSGFVNYVVSALFFLLVHYSIKKYYNNKVTKKYEYVYLFFIGLISTLFIENITVALFIIMFIINIVYLFKNKKINFPLLTLFIGVIIGTILMFIHPSYLNLIIGSTVNDRYIPQDANNLIYYFNRNIKSILHYLISDNFFLNSITIFTFIICFLKTKTKEIYLPIILIIINTISIFLCICDVKLVLTIFNIFYLIIYLIIIYKLIGKDKEVVLFISYLVLLTLPLLIINPVGERLFFLHYLLFIMILFRVVNKYSLESNYNKLYTILLLVFYLFLLFVSFNNIKTEYMIKDYVIKQTSIGKKIINIPIYPYPDNVWFSDFGKIRYFMYYYSLYNGFDTDVTYDTINYEDWLKLINK